MQRPKEDPIDRANRRRLESDDKWIDGSSRKAADQLLTRTQTEANRLVGCKATIEHDIQSPGGMLDQLVLRYHDAAVYVTYHQAPDPSAPSWPFPLVGIWKQGIGRFRHARPQTEPVYFRVVPATGDGDSWRWRVVNSGPNEGIEEDLHGMAVMIFELLTSDPREGA